MSNKKENLSKNRNLKKTNNITVFWRRVFHMLNWKVISQFSNNLSMHLRLSRINIQLKIQRACSIGDQVNNLIADASEITLQRFNALEPPLWQLTMSIRSYKTIGENSHHHSRDIIYSTNLMSHSTDNEEIIIN